MLHRSVRRTRGKFICVGTMCSKSFLVSLYGRVLPIVKLSKTKLEQIIAEGTHGPTQLLDGHDTSIRSAASQASSLDGPCRVPERRSELKSECKNR